MLGVVVVLTIFAESQWFARRRAAQQATRVG